MTAQSITSDVDICNAALIPLRQSPISSIDTPKNTTEEKCAAIYHITREATLRAHPWNFAIKRAELSANPAAAPPFGFTHAYPLPDDFIRYLSRHDDLGTRLGILDSDDYGIENGHYLFNGEDGVSLNIKYIYDHKVVTSWDPLFIELLVVSIAIKLAPGFSARQNVITDLKNERLTLSTLAKGIDGQERPPNRVQRSRLIRARRAGGSTVASRFVDLGS